MDNNGNPDRYHHAILSRFRLVPAPAPQSTFGDREYRFDYDAVRKRNGLAWYPIVTQPGKIEWVPDPPTQKPALKYVGAQGLSRTRVHAGKFPLRAGGTGSRSLWLGIKTALCEEVWKHFEP